MADIDPLEYRQRTHPDLDIASTASPSGTSTASSSPAASVASGQLLRDILGVLRDSYCRTVGHRVHAHPGPGAARWFQEHLEKP
jgi:2-oxoglutarate dehydrogenase E1 component